MFYDPKKQQSGPIENRHTCDMEVINQLQEKKIPLAIRLSYNSQWGIAKKILSVIDHYYSLSLFLTRFVAF